ncbi:MAG: Gfo/Idh/MocA family oxidoreductase [Planctomycetaceae bacterium]|nr:Gfo/Idh/MocA family oxidoreductase [Planctomycetaceae bacterium]
MDELRIGVIGAGGRGGLAGHAHKPDQGSCVVAACDIRPEMQEHVKKWYGPDCFFCTDYRDLLKRSDVHAVFVTTPDNFHEEHATAALEAGKAVYCEKPLAITIAGADRILNAARDRKGKLYVGHNMRHFPAIIKMRQLIDAGAIGQVKAAWCRHFVSYGGDAYYKDWHSDRRNSTGLLLQKGAHDIDVLHWLCGGYTRRVTAMGKLAVYGQITDRHEGGYGHMKWDQAFWPPLSQTQLSPIIDVEDVSMMLMELDNGVLASYQQCHFTPDAWRDYTIIGTLGRIENYNDCGACDIHLWNRRADGYRPKGDEVFHVDGEMGGHGGADERIVAEFVRWVRSGGTIATSPVAARYSIAAGCMATHSLRNGSQPQDVPPLPADLEQWFAKTR